jgi:hypothetical protein
MNLLAIAVSDAQQILENDWSVDVTFNNGSIVKTVKAVASRHHLDFNDEGVPINSENAHVSVSEQTLLDAEFPTRNGNNEVNLVDVLVSYADVNQVVKTYQIDSVFPSETLGIFVLTLGTYKP